jgi:hypothetical protein
VKLKLAVSFGLLPLLTVFHSAWYFHKVDLVGVNLVVVGRMVMQTDVRRIESS